MTGDVLRTPDRRFADLPGYAFEPRYVDVDGLRVHHLDEGPADGRPVLLLHGEPSWSYLYRHLVAPLVGAGLRVIAPDLVGFGRSDKPVDRAAHTYAAHVDWMHTVVRTLDLRNAILVGQDWGGLIGLRVLALDPERFAGVVAANTGLPDGRHDPGKAFHAWREFALTTPDFQCGAVVQMATTTELPAAVVAAYDAPFPEDVYLAGPRTMPALVPTTPDAPGAAENAAAWEVLRRFDRPFLCAFSDRDPITRGADRPFRDQVPGARDQPHTTIAGAGHFLQEDAGAALAAVVVELAGRLA